MGQLVNVVKLPSDFLAGEGVAKRRDSSFSPATLRFCWLAFVTLHVFCLIYFTTFAWCYWNLPGTSLAWWFLFFHVGLGSDHDHAIAVVHGCLAAVHLIYLIWMVGWTLKKRRLVFAVYNTFSRPGTSTRKLDEGWISRLRSAYCAALSKTDILGVDGPYFDLVLLGREIIETALQTQQAYRMSALLPRTELNRGYTAMLVINCWSTALAHSVYRVDATKRRLLAVVCDCALDLMTSVGITSVLLAIYSRDFDYELSGFPLSKWYEDVWVVHVLSEFQILVVKSWGDLTFRVVFAISMISDMNNIKTLLSRKVPQLKRKSKSNQQVAAVLSLDPSIVDGSESRRQRKLDVVVASEFRFTQILFFLWGTTILILHLYAESIPELSQCKMQVKPWITSQPSCSLLVTDCYEFNISGAKDEVVNLWRGFDPKTTVRVVIRHCSHLEVPALLQEFSSLNVLKLYNSTIESWEESATISQKYHPDLNMLYLVRVTMVNGELPMGLLGGDFPEMLRDIEFCHTNLRTLPDDFDLKWPKFASIYFEACEFTEVPASLARLAPIDLSLASNPISSIPAAIMQNDVGFLHIGSTLISELPQLVSDVSPSMVLRVDNTNISFFWDWMDTVVASIDSMLPPPILATYSPYCSDLQKIYAGKKTRFSAPLREGQSLLLSNASVENWPVLQAAVSCILWPSTWFPLDFEDGYSGIKTE